MRRWTSARLLFRDQRIGRLLDPVVRKAVGALLVKDEPGVNCLPQGRVHRRLRLPVHQGQGGDFGGIAQAGELLQGVPGAAGSRFSLPVMRSTTLSV